LRLQGPRANFGNKIIGGCFGMTFPCQWLMLENRMLSTQRKMPATKNYDRLIANLQHKPWPDSLVTTNWPIPWHETSASCYSLDSLEFCHRVSLALWHFHQKQMPSIGLETKKHDQNNRVANVIVHLYSAKTTATQPKLRMSQLQWRRILRHWVFFWGVGLLVRMVSWCKGVYIGFIHWVNWVSGMLDTWKLRSYYLITN